MSEADALLAAVCEAPEDDAPRLVYADWLEEHGDQNRADFIRGQIALAAMDEDNPAFEELAKRLQALERGNVSRWRKGLPGGMNVPSASTVGGLLERPDHLPHSQFDRGFLGAVTCSAELWSDPAERLLERLPVRAVELTYARLPRVIQDSHLGRLSGVGLAKGILGDEGAAALAGAAWLPALRVLLLDEKYIGAEVSRTLFRGTEFPQLRRLTLAGNLLGPQGLENLAEVRAPALEHLDLSSVHPEDAGLVALARCSSLGRLRHLDLNGGFERGGSIHDAGLSALAGSPHLTALERLFLGSHSIGPAGARSLGEAPFLPRLTHLSLSYNPLGAEGVQGLTAGTAGRLRSLALDSCRVGAGVEQLAAWPGLAGLRDLFLGHNDIGAHGAIALARSPFLTNLHNLNLWDNGITDEGVQALAHSPHLGKLRALQLERNRFGDAGLLALADSPLGESLRELRVYGNSFTQATRRKVKERMGARVTF
jgi:uncharacterized protein (TIGR02996 family)